MDNIETSVLFIILLCLILCSAFFSGTETAMMSLNRYKLKYLVKNGDKAAIRVNELLEKPDRLIGLILIGNNLVNILASSLATILGLRLYGQWGIALATGLLTFVILIFSEIAPKTIAVFHAEKIASINSFILKPLMWLLYPFVWGASFLSNQLLRLLGMNTNHVKEEKVAPDELRSILHDASDLISTKYKDMLISILDLENVQVEDIMVPRAEIYAIDINNDFKDILKQLSHSPFSKIVLYRDNIDDVVGFIHLSDLFRFVTKEGQFNLKKDYFVRSIKEMYFIPKGTQLSVQLLNFQTAKEKAGLIVDEYGDIQGMITLDDILQEIVGDFNLKLHDSNSELVFNQQEGFIIVEGMKNIRDFNKETGLELPVDLAKTINGLIVEQLKSFPKNNTKLVIDNYRIEVVEVVNNAVKYAKIFVSK